MATNDKGINYGNLSTFKTESDKVYIANDKAQSLSDTAKVQAQNNMMGKAYAPAQNSGLGKVYLDKNNGVLTQSMINVANTVYVIQYDYTMSGNITVPAGCILQFDGGSISGSDSYSLTGNNTDIQASPSAKIFSGVDIQGTWVVTDIYLTWMNIPKYNDCRDEVHSIMRLQNDNIYQNIYLPNREISYTPSFDNVAENRYFFILSSNTHLHVINKIKVNGNDATHYHVIHAYDKSNVTVDGGGSVIGDVGSHQYISGSSSEWGYGVSFISVKYGIIKDLTITHCIGDGININGIDTTVEEGSVEKASEYITIDNVSCLYNRRDGMALEFCANVSVYNSTFAHTGKIEYTSGGCGVDIEPYRSTHCTKNVLFENCKFYDNVGNSLKVDSRASYVIDAIVVINCEVDKEILANEDSDGYLPVDIPTMGISLYSKRDIANLKNICIKNTFVRAIQNYSYGNNDIIVRDSNVCGICHYTEEADVKCADIYFYNCNLYCGKVVSTHGAVKSPAFFKAFCNWYFYNCDINFNTFKDYDGDSSLNTLYCVYTHFFTCKSKSILGTKIDVVNSTYPSSFGYIARGVKTSIINSVFTDTDAFLIQAPIQYPNSEDETIDLTIINTKLVGTVHHPWARADYIFDFGPSGHDITHLNGNIVIDGLSSATVKRTKVCADTILSNTVGTKKIDSNTPWFDGTKPAWWNGANWVDANGTVIQ